MSKKLLLDLNGTNNGAFRRWLDDFNGEPRIAWYPSAGDDFRDLLYLNPGFSKKSPASQTEPPPPDIFLHTDYFPWSNSAFLDNPKIYMDDRTKVNVKSIEELPRCNLPLDDKIVDFPQGSDATSRVLFLEIEVISNELGTVATPLVYAFVENAAFCAKCILPNEGRLSHIVHVRFGGGLGGGGKSTGVWLRNILQTVHCEVFVTDGHYDEQLGDKRIYALYPDLADQNDNVQLTQIRVVKSEGWSGHGDVFWKIVNQI